MLCAVEGLAPFKERNEHVLSNILRVADVVYIGVAQLYQLLRICIQNILNITVGSVTDSVFGIHFYLFPPPERQTALPNNIILCNKKQFRGA